MSAGLLKAFTEALAQKARKPKADAWKDEPLLGYSPAREENVGVLGLPHPQEPDWVETILSLLSCLPKIVPETGPQMARAVAAEGRGGDREIAHLTPGEVVIPKRLQTPEVLAALKRAAQGPLDRYTVGSRANRINPRTGAPEFDDPYDDQFDDLVYRYDRDRPAQPVEIPPAKSDEAVDVVYFDGHPTGFTDATAAGADSANFSGLKQAADAGRDQATQALNDAGYGSVAPKGSALPMASNPTEEITVTAPPASPKARPLAPYMRQAQVAYGETAGLRPRLIDPQGSPEDPSNWDSESADQLAKTRADLAALYERNHIMHSAMPTDYKNPIQMREWLNTLHATNQAEQAQRTMDPRIDREYMIQEGLSQNVPQYDPILHQGPFYNVGGQKTVPRGNRTYVDLYTDRKK